MANIKNFLNLITPQYIPIAFFGLLVGIVSTINSLPDWRFWIAAASVICIVSGFNSFNAIADREIDRINKPYRPIPNKRISEIQALYFALASYALALILAFLINSQFFVIIFISVIITIAYSYPGIYLKKKFFIGTMIGTIFYAILCPLAGWALYPTNAIPFPIIFFLFILGLSLSVSKDFTDLAGDHFNQIQTLPVKLGYLQSIAMMFIFLTFSFFFLIFLIMQTLLPEKYYVLLIFFPLSVLNINTLRDKQKQLINNHFFFRTVLLIILLESTIVVLELI